MEQTDYLIVGAGTGGCVLAARLTEAGHSVCLLEAGADVDAVRTPDDIGSIYPLSLFNSSYAWADTPVRWGGPASPVTTLLQGRVVGGSSAIMGMFTSRGVPNDYALWEEAGAKGWGWDEVLPYFKRLETDADFDGPDHGKAGPIPIMREAPSSLPPFAGDIALAAKEAGFAFIEDANGDFNDGFAPLPFSRTATRRGSAGLCYLTPIVRARQSLRILERTQALRLLFEGRRVIGALVTGPDGRTRPLGARRTILCAGALRSPELLLRSGIGPGAALQHAGVETIADRPGVGANLQNHPMLYPLTVLRPKGRSKVSPRPIGSGLLRWSSDIAGGSPGDIVIYVNVGLSWHGLGQRLAALAPAVMAPASRGWVKLDPRAPQNPPEIVFNMLGDPRDVERLAAGFEVARRLIQAAHLRGGCGPAFVLNDSGDSAQANIPSRKNAVIGAIGGAIADLAPGLLMRQLRKAADLRELAGWDPTAMQAYAREAVTGAAHVAGTCRMGLAEDRLAVTSSDGSVHGVEGLHVADASVMPTVPSGSTHIPTIMVAEKIADMLNRRR